MMIESNGPVIIEFTMYTAMSAEQVKCEGSATVCACMWLPPSEGMHTVCPAQDGRVRYKEFCDLMESAYNEPDLEKKPTTTVVRPLRGHLSRVSSVRAMYT